MTFAISTWTVIKYVACSGVGEYLFQFQSWESFERTG